MTFIRWSAFLGLLGSITAVVIPGLDDSLPEVPSTVVGDTPVTARSALDVPEPFFPSEAWRMAPPLKRPLPPIPAGPRPGYGRGEDPALAEAAGWPVEGPAPLPGALLPEGRIVAYYGNPLSRRMGALGETDPDEMRVRFEEQLDEWRAADPETPVVPALHLIAIVAQQDPGPSGDYRMIMRDSLIAEVYGWAQEMGAILFLDVQSGQGHLPSLVRRLEPWLRRPDVHLGVDPEFNMPPGVQPGTRIGSLPASEINEVSTYLGDLVTEHDLPPKVLVVHRFTQGMVRDADEIVLRPEVEVVMHMDGWGEPWLKRATYESYIVREPVQYAGFKVFYHNDTRGGVPWMLPEDILRLHPIPVYIQYQ